MEVIMPKKVGNRVEDHIKNDDYTLLKLNRIHQIEQETIKNDINILFIMFKDQESKNTLLEAELRLLKDINFRLVESINKTKSEIIQEYEAHTIKIKYLENKIEQLEIKIHEQIELNNQKSRPSNELETDKINMASIEHRIFYKKMQIITRIILQVFKLMEWVAF